MRTPARFPGVPVAAGHYESFYVKACHPDGGLAVWIRYTVHKPPGGPPVGAVWFTLFDAGAGVIASKARFERPAAGEDHYIDMDGCRPVTRSATRPASGSSPPGSCGSTARSCRSGTSPTGGCIALRSRARSS